MTTDELFTAFQNPGAVWRGKPFWAWNGRLDKTELLRQVHVMKEMGLGGFFMHSRVGLVTEYLGDEWFECINACADEAEKLGMEAWLYDEDRWPSGSAGGLVTQNPEFRMRFLRCTVVPESEWASFPSLPPAPSPPDNGREGVNEWALASSASRLARAMEPRPVARLPKKARRSLITSPPSARTFGDAQRAPGL